MSSKNTQHTQNEDTNTTIETSQPAEIQEETVTTEEREADKQSEKQEELEALKERLAQAEAQAAEYLDGWQRTQAEFSNYKKRQEKERAQMLTLANVNLLRKLLPIVDDFERALASMPTGLERLTWCEGISLIKAKLDVLLETEGVKPISVEGQAFDPHFHEAVTHEEVTGYEDGQIIGEVQRGYTLGEWVLRPALVRVAKAPASPTAPEPGTKTVTDEESGEDNGNNGNGKNDQKQG